MPSKLLFKSITFAESMAISVPLLTLTPISAFISAILSLIPSPHIITTCFSSFNLVIIFALSCGSTFEIIFDIPKVFPNFFCNSIIITCKHYSLDIALI